jgi:hypothetical protein
VIVGDTLEFAFEVFDLRKEINRPSWHACILLAGILPGCLGENAAAAAGQVEPVIKPVVPQGYSTFLCLFGARCRHEAIIVPTFAGYRPADQ